MIHYYKINFDGSDLVELTSEKANRDATFSKEWKYVVENFSRTDMAPQTVFRSMENGKYLYGDRRGGIDFFVKHLLGDEPPK